MSPMRFRLLDTLGDANDEELCLLENFVQGIERKSWCAQLGERLSPFYPQDAKIFMSPDYPGIKLASLLGNTNGMLIVSTEFKEAIQKHSTNEIEYLPFTLYDHRKRVYSRDYFLINPIGTYDCLDLKASDITWLKNEPDKVSRIREYVIDREKAKNAPQLFRVAQDPANYVVGQQLAVEMHARKLTNIMWTRLRFSDEPEQE